MAQCVAYGFYLYQKVSNMVLGFFHPTFIQPYRVQAMYKLYRAMKLYFTGKIKFPYQKPKQKALFTSLPSTLF